jgi:hypothetical protein
MDKLTSSYSDLLTSCQSLEKEILGPEATNHELKETFAEVLRVTTTDAVRSDWTRNGLSCFVPPQSGFFSSLSVPDWIESSNVYKSWKKGGSKLKKVESRGEVLSPHGTEPFSSGPGPVTSVDDQEEDGDMGEEAEAEGADAGRPMVTSEMGKRKGSWPLVRMARSL